MELSEMVGESGRVVGRSFSNERPVYICDTGGKGVLKVGEI